MAYYVSVFPFISFSSNIETHNSCLAPDGFETQTIAHYIQQNYNFAIMIFIWSPVLVFLFTWWFADYWNIFKVKAFVNTVMNLYVS
jgi:hypothetical protein